mmetsp:Transcript_1004/g.3406  ORF Transcript_1004/g.3406 Transcript_1004/m.3406 type:complete len:302 (+) Transcript_1004:42-947(+)
MMRPVQPEVPDDDVPAWSSSGQSTTTRPSADDAAVQSGLVGSEDYLKLLPMSSSSQRPPPESFDCVVVGAGIAGLSAARECQASGLSVVVLEASERLGGRIRTLEVGDARVDCGAEFVHGDVENPLLAAIGAAGLALKEAPWPNYYYLGKENLLTRAAPVELEAANEAFDRIRNDFVQGETLLQYFVRQGVSSRVLDLADAIYANDYGNAASEIGAYEVAFEQERWRHGEAYFVLETTGTLGKVVAYLAKDLDVRFQHHVADLFFFGRGRRRLRMRRLLQSEDRRRRRLARGASDNFFQCH